MFIMTSINATNCMSTTTVAVFFRTVSSLQISSDQTLFTLRSELTVAISQLHV